MNTVRRMILRPRCNPVCDPCRPARQIESKFSKLSVQLSCVRFIERGTELSEPVDVKTHAMCVLGGQTQEPLTNFWFKFNLTPHSVCAILTGECHCCERTRSCADQRKEAAAVGELDATGQTDHWQLPSMVEKPSLTSYDGAEDGIRTHDPHLGKVRVFVLLGPPGSLKCGSVHPVSRPSTQSLPVVERSTMR